MDIQPQLCEPLHHLHKCAGPVGAGDGDERALRVADVADLHSGGVEAQGKGLIIHKLPRAACPTKVGL